MFFPVRGDTAIHYVDITDEGTFVCGREAEFGGDSDTALRCSSGYQVSEGKAFRMTESGDIAPSTRPPDPTVDEEEVVEGDPVAEFRLPAEPFDLAASEDGRVLVASHQLGGYASSIINSWTERPELVHIMDGLPENPIGVAALPSTDSPDVISFLMTYRSEAQVDLLRFDGDGLVQATSPAGPTDEQIGEGPRTLRPELLHVASAAITLNSSGFNNRGVLVDSARREAAVAACGGDADCVSAAQGAPLDIYVANREPNSLLVGRTGGEDPNALISSLPEFYDNIPLTAGPSRVVAGNITNAAGEKEPRIFVLCFDSALIYVYDPERRAVESEIRTGRGPYSMAFDPDTAMAFVGHFTDSYVGVVSLDQRHPMTYGATLATLGEPEPPRAAQ
jgi:hypothetical protein